MKKECKKCGSYIRVTAKFCMECGNKLLSPMEEMQNTIIELREEISKLKENKIKKVNLGNDFQHTPEYKTYMRDVATKAQELIKTEGISKSEAFKKAYMIRNKPIIPKVNFYGKIESKQKIFPNMIHIENNIKQLLEVMVKNVVTSPFTANLSYLMEGKMLGIVDLVEWHEFTADFMCKSDQVAKYFGVHNNFKMNGKSNISYG